MSNSDPRDAVSDMVRGLQSVFKKYSRSARRRGWNALTSTKGKRQISKLIDSPSRPVVGITRLLRFKEWLEDEQGPEFFD